MPIKEANDPYRDILIGMVPEIPSLPSFPQLQWSYKNEKYCINEEDTDKLLNYGENVIPLFRHNLEQFEIKIHLILQALKQQ